jgi:hypothetical protein
MTNTVTFKRPFVLGDFDEVQPAGAYRVETDEELLEGISFPAYRRTLTLIHLHAQPGHPGRTQMLDIDPNDLEAALMRDQAPAEIPAEPDAGVSAERHAQPTRQVVDARSSLGLEPDLDEMMSDPIVRLVMRRDGLSEAVVWDAIKTARAHLASRSGAETMIGATELHQAEADRQAMERGEDEGILVHLR